MNKTLATASLLVVACGGGTDPEPTLYPATVLVSPGEASLEISTDSVVLTATVKDQNGDTMDTVSVTWSSEDTAVATVTPGGVVSPAGNGVAKILATVDSVSGSASIAVELDIQRETLVSLYESLNGDGWVLNDNWGTTAPLGDWYGVSTDGEAVTEVILSGNDVSGRVPVDIVRLEHLRTLDLGYNEGVTGRILPEFGEMENLRVLALHHNSLTGTIPPELANLELTVFDFHANQLTGHIPEWMGEQTRLGTFRVDANSFTGSIPSSFGKLTRLHTLMVGNNSGMSGRLPRELLNLDLIWFSWAGTNLCSPPDDEFQEWLDDIPNHQPGRKCSS